jgi:hypothetical protein
MTLIFNYGHILGFFKKTNMFFKKVQKWTKINVQNEKNRVRLLAIFINFFAILKNIPENLRNIPQERAALRAA